jgi:hypothetical protein
MMVGHQLTKYYLQRALHFVRINRLEEAATDALAAISGGDRKSILRLQVLLAERVSGDTTRRKGVRQSEDG